MGGPRGGTLRARIYEEFRQVYRQFVFCVSGMKPDHQHQRYECGSESESESSVRVNNQALDYLKDKRVV